MRRDQIYALAALHADVRKALGIADNVNINLEIEQAISVIRFTEQLPRADAIAPGVDGAIDADFDVEPDAGFTQALRAAGARIDQDSAQPEEMAAIRTAIAKRGLDPCAVLSDEQYRAQYGRAIGFDSCS